MTKRCWWSSVRLSPPNGESRYWTQLDQAWPEAQFSIERPPSGRGTLASFSTLVPWFLRSVPVPPEGGSLMRSDILCMAE